MKLSKQYHKSARYLECPEFKWFPIDNYRKCRHSPKKRPLFRGVSKGWFHCIFEKYFSFDKSVGVYFRTTTYNIGNRAPWDTKTVGETELLFVLSRRGQGR